MILLHILRCLCDCHMWIWIFKLVYSIFSCIFLIYSTKCCCYIICKCSIYNVSFGYCVSSCCSDFCSRLYIFEYRLVKCYAFLLCKSDRLHFIINVLYFDCKCNHITSFEGCSISLSFMCLINY